MASRRGTVGDWRDLADALAGAPDLHAAFDTIVAGVSRALKAPSCIVERAGHDWRLLAQARGGLPLALGELSRALDGIASEMSIATFELATSPGTWTSVPLDARGGSTATLVVAGDHAGNHTTLGQLAVWIPFALASLRDRQARDAAARLAFGAYATTRRASRVGRIEAVAQRIVEQVARSIDAERIALAIYRPDEDCLAVIATSGYAADQVRHARIGPGEWVMGHVYASGRPVVVSDVRQIRAVSRGRRPYRTFSFAAMPVVAGRAMLGVLSATDKVDGSTFDRRDTLALRTFSGIAALALAASSSEEELHRLSRAANIDALTGLFNRPYLDSRLVEEIERAKRSTTPLAVLMADIDDFKIINDTYGHPVGDAVLQAVGSTLRSSVRVFDVCARYGGDEFAILMPASDQLSAVGSANRVRERLAESYRTDASLAHLRPSTISVGVAVLEAGDTPADLLRRADEAMYRAKADGKNLVRATEPKTLPSLQWPHEVWPSNCDE